MKKVLFVFLSVLSIGFFSSCDKDKDLQTDDVLIQEIMTAENRVAVEPQDLPSSITTLSEKLYFESYLETCIKAPNKGFEVRLGTEEQLFFDIDGNVLKPSKKKKHNCGGKMAEKIEAEDLPATITSYITENYPGVDIKGAKQVSDKYIVGLVDHTMLVFDESGSFVEEGSCFKHHCGGKGIPVPIEDLPSIITDYIANNYPTAVIKKAAIKGEKMIVGLLDGDTRIILGFDADGNLVFVR
ncbi:MAG: PepSY-like domain-containing protein [Saprospiraceae bacterium]